MAPIASVVVKDIGGALLYELKLWVKSYRRSRRLDIIEGRIAKIYDKPDAAPYKQQVQKKYYEVSNQLLYDDLEEVVKMSKMSEPKSNKESRPEDFSEDI
ncbi:hypothetical protein I9H06_10850 [Pseudomonas tremae]|uniref:hypothetical protein n=1 Tax=Pseudomonas tremae TaxID=200454 RepID=UPI0020101C69|nr:hypothetical protein [Pseudomonas tremae]UQB33693.1 hypothetical protein I9H06_10850 [Pseudomonas tremae]